jgi:hypothetical protein
MMKDTPPLTPQEQQLVKALQELNQQPEGTLEWNLKFKQVWERIYKCPKSRNCLYRRKLYDKNLWDDVNIQVRMKELSEHRLQNGSVSAFLNELGADLEKQSPEQIIPRFNGWLRSLSWYVAQDIFKKMKNNKVKLVSFDAPLNGKDKDEGTNVGDKIHSPNIEGLDGQIEKDQAQHKANSNQRLYEYIEHDPDKILRSYYPGQRRGQPYPQANLWEVSKRRFLQEPPQDWEQLCKDLQIPFGTISAYSSINLNTVLLWVFIQKIDKDCGRRWWDLIEKDQTNDLRSLHFPSIPNCHAQYLAKQLLLQDPAASMHQLADRFGILPVTKMKEVKSTGKLKEVTLEPKDRLQHFWHEQCLPLLYRLG